MDQIRFDFLNSVGSNSRSNANANTAEPSDAFAQILDQQLTRRAESSPDRRQTESRTRSDASDRTDDPRPQVLKRRDSKTAALPAKQDAASAKPAPKPKPPEKTASSDAAGTKPAAKPKPDETDKPAEAAVCGPTTTENNAPTQTAEDDSEQQTPDQGAQQQGDDTPQQQPSESTDPTAIATTGTELSLLAMLAVPLPLQTITTNADASAEITTAAAGGDGAAALLQASLAASLAGPVDLTGATDGKPQAPANAGSLKFGAILNAGVVPDQKTAGATLAALQDAAEQIAKSADPLAQPTPAAAEAKPQDTGAKSSNPTKPRDADQATAATVTPELKAPAAAVQAMNRAPQVTWSGTSTVRGELAESMAVNAGSSFAADDAEFSNWSQALGSGASGLGNSLSARQSAFMAQLKQNLQILPPHEQIAVQIRDAMQNGNSRVTVALHPVELGRVEVKLEIDKEKNVSATVIVDRPATLDLLRNDAKALERALQDAGLQTGSGSLSFNLRDSNGQDGSAAQNGTGTGGGSGTGAGGSDAKSETVRPDVVATANGYVDLET
jgi:flagellar hook-length control protein FliK